MRDHDGGPWLLPIDSGLWQTAQDCCVWEGSLVQDDDDGQANGNGQANLNSEKGNTE